MPQKYNDYHLDIILQLSQSLKNHPALGKYQGADDLGYIFDIQQGLEYLSEEVKAAKHNTIDTASGMRMRSIDFGSDDLKNLPHALDNCHESITDVLKDRDLMRQEPLLHAYLRYADMQMKRAGMEGTDALVHFEDPATSVAAGIFNAFAHLPDSAEMEQIRQQDKEAYAAGQAMIQYLNAYVDYYTPDPPVKPGELGKLDPEALKAEKIRKMENLQQKALAFTKAGEKNVRAFLEASGNSQQIYNFSATTFNADPEPRPQDSPEHFQNRLLLGHGPKAVEAQLRAQRALLLQGVSLEESRLMIEFATQIKAIKSDSEGRNFYVRNMTEPFKSQMEKLVRLSDECHQRLTSGFASTEEKNEFFKTLAESAEDYKASVYDSALGRKILADPKVSTTIQNVNDNYSIKMFPLLQSESSVFNRVIHLKNREAALDKLSHFGQQIEFNPSFSVLLNTGKHGMGPKDQKEYQDFEDFRKTVDTVARLSSKKHKNSLEKKRLGECYLTLEQKSEAYLKDVLDDPDRSQNPKTLNVTKERVIGALDVLQRTNPEKAEIMRRKTAGLFGRELSREEVSQEAVTLRDRKPNYSRYFQLHTGQAVSDVPAGKLSEYAAKAAAALLYLNEPHREFNIAAVRGTAQILLDNPEFRAVLKATGSTKLRETLSSGDPVRIAKLTGGGEIRYAVSAEAKSKFAALAAGMDTNKRSKKWLALKQTLGNASMKDSRGVFNAVEGYLKGKKAVSSDPKRQESVRLALNALAIAAKNGDEVAKARAQILVDRFNKVRGVQPGHKDYVDLKNFGVQELAAEQPKNQMSLSN